MCTCFQQRQDTIAQMLDSLKGYSKKEVKAITEQLDNYGNTPLGLSCVYQYENK